jgi:hypothetical protein
MNKHIVRAMSCCALAILALPAECLALTSMESQRHPTNQLAHRWQQQEPQQTTAPETTGARPAFQNQQQILNGDQPQQVEQTEERVEDSDRRWRRHSRRSHRRGHYHQRYWGDR